MTVYDILAKIGSEERKDCLIHPFVFTAFY